MSDDFKKRIVDGYESDPAWIRIREFLDAPRIRGYVSGQRIDDAKRLGETDLLYPYGKSMGLQDSQHAHPIRTSS